MSDLSYWGFTLRNTGANRLKIIAVALLLQLALVPVMLSVSRSQAKYCIVCDSRLLESSMDSCRLQVGVVEETGRNDGRQIEQYLASVGLGAGNPYCYAGQYWCFAVAAKALSLASSEIPIKKTGLASEAFFAAKKTGKRIKLFLAKYDLIVWRKGKTVFGHVERIVSVGKGGWVITVGFNTSGSVNGSQMKGEGVYQKKRNIYHLLGRMPLRGLIGFIAINNVTKEGL